MKRSIFNPTEHQLSVTLTNGNHEYNISVLPKHKVEIEDYTISPVTLVNHPELKIINEDEKVVPHTRVVPQLNASSTPVSVKPASSSITKEEVVPASK